MGEFYSDADTDLRVSLRPGARRAWHKVADWEQIHPHELARVWLTSADQPHPDSQTILHNRSEVDRLSRGADGRWRGRRHAEHAAADIIAERTAEWSLEVVDWLVAVCDDLEAHNARQQRTIRKQRRKIANRDKQIAEIAKLAA